MRQIDVPGAGIAQTDGRLQRASGEKRVGEIEEIDGACGTCRAQRARIAGRADRQLQPIERNRCAELFQAVDRHRQILAAAIALPDNRFEHRRAERLIGKAEQIDRTGEDQAVKRTTIARRPDRKPVAVE